MRRSHSFKSLEDDFAVQIEGVKKILEGVPEFANELIDNEVDWLYRSMGIDRIYFQQCTNQQIANDVMSIYAAKLLAKTRGTEFSVDLEQERDDSAMYLCKSTPGSGNPKVSAVENRIEAKYLLAGYRKTDDTVKVPHRVVALRSRGQVAPDTPVQLRMYCTFEPEFSCEIDENERDIKTVGDKTFLQHASPNTIQLFQNAINQAFESKGPVFQYFNIQDLPGEPKNQKRIIAAFRQGSTHSYFSSMSFLYHFHGLFCTKKFVEQFANNYTVMSIYVKPFKEMSEQEYACAMDRLLEDAALLCVLPRTGFTPHLRNKEAQLTPQEVTYAYVMWKFAYTFLNHTVDTTTQQEMMSHVPSDSSMVRELKERLRRETFTEGRVFEIISNPTNIPLVRLLHAHFRQLFEPSQHRACESTTEITEDYIRDQIARVSNDRLDEDVFRCGLKMNLSITKTNWYKPSKSALGFRLKGDFLSQLDYPERPFAILFFVGPEFRGFHIRFAEVARGGVRLIRSQDKSSYNLNSASLFSENYNLAYTQQKKNKDIPEGGSKGTILLSNDHQDKGQEAFRKYVSCLLDILLPHPMIIDRSGIEEILFLGPDEGTAGYMDWAALYAKERGASFWRAFTTGKSLELGGIPHDKYGMTTHSVHQYVVCTLENFGLQEADCTKVQTGGPDGDLGSNEILISKDKTCAIVDGSGVLYDPNGINREELIRLARARLPCQHFDRSKLSPQGALVLVSDSNVTLPDGTLVENGMRFRNQFHLNPLFHADYFVPCGGRPEAVNTANVSAFLKDGRSRFKFIVEGANLFFSPEARVVLEDAGCVLYKDASANKGGVTSSSFEVLSALALSNEQFAEHMCVHGNTPSVFYETYVHEVKDIIAENARLEWKCIQAEKDKGSTANRSELSDLLSLKINSLNSQIRESSLWNNHSLRKLVLQRACPAALLNMLGIQTFVERVPESYVRAIFGAYLAAHYVYNLGLATNEFGFFEFIGNLVSEAASN